MKSYYQDLHYKLINSSLASISFNGEEIEFNLHHHAEYEIVYIDNGYGQRIIGNKIQAFNNGDFLLVNTMVPHTWYPTSAQSQVMVLQFPVSLINTLSLFPEFKLIEQFFGKLHSYAAFEKSSAVFDRIRIINLAKEEERLLLFMPLLLDLVKGTYEMGQSSQLPDFNPESENRINIVCKYIQQHYKQPISLHEASQLICMSDTNFCNFFKRCTGITFTKYLNLIRIYSACRDLENSDKTIAQIAFENGFENTSYFNRVFKNEINQSPKVYRNSFEKNLLL